MNTEIMTEEFHEKTEKTSTSIIRTADGCFQITLQTMEGCDLIKNKEEILIPLNMTHISFSSEDGRMIMYTTYGKFKIIINQEEDDACFINIYNGKNKIYLKSSAEAKAIAEFLKVPLYTWDDNGEDLILLAVK